MPLRSAVAEGHDLPFSHGNTELVAYRPGYAL